MARARRTNVTPEVAPSLEMRDAWRLFQRGNNRLARKAALLVRNDPSASQEAVAEANDLLGRISFDPVAALAMGGIALTITVIVILLVIAHRFAD